MAILNFKEIPQANKNSGEQDLFELFARDFFEYLGYKIIFDPNHSGPGGKTPGSRLYKNIKPNQYKPT